MRLSGFVGLFRTADLVALTFGQLNFLNPGLLHVLFTDSKVATFSWAQESVQVKDRLLIRVLASWAAGKMPGDSVFQFTYVKFAGLFKHYGNLFDVVSPRLTPHGLRRGGATGFLSYTAVTIA